MSMCQNLNWIEKLIPPFLSYWFFSEKLNKLIKHLFRQNRLLFFIHWRKRQGTCAELWAIPLFSVVALSSMQTTYTMIQLPKWAGPIDITSKTMSNEVSFLWQLPNTLKYTRGKTRMQMSLWTSVRRKERATQSAVSKTQGNWQGSLFKGSFALLQWRPEKPLPDTGTS